LSASSFLLRASRISASDLLVLIKSYTFICFSSSFGLPCLGFSSESSEEDDDELDEFEA